MKTHWSVVIVLCGTSPLSAAHIQSRSSGYEPARVVSVAEQEVSQPGYWVGDNPSDAPLRTQAYAYDITVRLQCVNYVVHYDSPFDYLPEALHADNQLPVRLAKHEMFFDLPGGRQMEMPIVRHQAAPASACGSMSNSR